MAKTKKQIPPMGINLSIAQRPLVEALLLAHDGDALCEASDQLKEMVQAVREIGGSGSLSLKISVKGAGKKVAISVKVSSTKPQPETVPTPLFADDRGYLGQADPDQFEMNFDEPEEEEVEA